MLRVPLVRQPDNRSCLPACCVSVLRWQGLDVCFEEVARWCHLRITGCDGDLAVQGLRDSGLDVALHQIASVDDIAAAIDDGFAPIAIIATDDFTSHAVVVCDVRAGEIVVMDPARAEYVTWPIRAFLSRWEPLSGDALLIGSIGLNS